MFALPDLVTIGHVLMDIHFFVHEFPRADEEAKTDRLSLGEGGSAANVAVGASRLCVKSGFIGSVGFDTFGRVLLEELEHEGVDVTHVEVDTSISSGLTVIAINKKGEVMMFRYTGARDKLLPSDLDKKYIPSSEHIRITGLSFGTALAAAKIAKKAKVTVSFDPGRLMSGKGAETRSSSVKPETTLSEALEVMFKALYHDFLVEKDGVFQGIVTWNEIMKVKPEERIQLQVERLPMKISVFSDESILEAYKIMLREKIDLVPVVEKEAPEKVVDVVTSESVDVLL